MSEVNIEDIEYVSIERQNNRVYYIQHFAKFERLIPINDNPLHITCIVRAIKLLNLKKEQIKIPEEFMRMILN